MPDWLCLALALSSVFLFPARLPRSLFSGILCLGFFLLLSLLGDWLLKRRGREGVSLGGGDIKLLAACACAAGFFAALVLYALGQLLMLAFLGAGRFLRRPAPGPLPFAPFLLAALLLLPLLPI